MQANDSHQPLSLEATEERRGRNIGSVGRINKLEFFWQSLRTNRTLLRGSKKAKA